MTHPILFDGRNLYDPKTMAGHGFTYEAIGRGAVRGSKPA
jgi:UDPglucose 6-dehydrogenase